MVWTILQTIGSLLSGMSIFTAFVIYKKEVHDMHLKSIRESIANVRAIMEEQYSVLQSEYIFACIEEHTFSSMRMYIVDLAHYVERNLNQSAEEIKETANQLAESYKIFEYLPLFNNDIYINFKQKNQSITRCIIYDLTEFPDVTALLELYQNEAKKMQNIVNDILVDSKLSIDIICKVMLENKISINNEEIMKQRIVNAYLGELQKKYSEQRERLNAVYKISDMVLEKVLALDDCSLERYSKQKKTRDSVMKVSIEDRLSSIVNSIPRTIISPEERLECGRIIEGASKKC